MEMEIDDGQKTEEKRAKSRRRTCQIIAVLVICAVIGVAIGLIVYFTNNNDDGDGDVELVIESSAPSTRANFLVDCLAGLRLEKNNQTCADRGCLWQSDSKPGVPYCTYPENYGYMLASEPEITDRSYRFNLTRGPAPSLFGSESPDWQNVFVDVEIQTDSRVRIRFTSQDEGKWEIPTEMIDIESTNDNSASIATASFTVTYVKEPTFGIIVTRNDNNYTVFNSVTPGLVLSDQFLQLSTKLSNDKLFGIGEHRHETFKHDMNWKTWSLFTRDNGPNNDFNLYSQHPVYMNLEDDGKANIVLLKNSNAMDITLQPIPDPAVTYRTIGGVLDFYIYLGDSPKDAISKYVTSLGPPVFPPYWSLGFHLSRWGYKDIDDMRLVIERSRAAGIPYEAQWADIDTFDRKYVFTYDKDQWKEFPALVQNLVDEKRHFITIVDPGIGCNETIISEVEAKFPGWRAWMEAGSYVKTANNKTLIGEVWPGVTYYPDYSDPASQDWWTKGINFYRNNVGVKVDALWIDMNEPSSFVPGSTTGCDKNKYNYPPYVPNVLGADYEGRLYDKTICMDAQQYLGKHYDVHSLYAHTMAIRTFKSLEEVFPNKRPWTMTRSSFVGTGRYATKWQGDNRASWDNLRFSIIHLFDFGIFGFPMNGADICGFWLEPTREMCVRWQQLGAFYPFSRNHNGKGDDPQLFKHQDPAAWGQDFIDLVKPVMMTRQKLLPYFYTLLYYAHTKGELVIRPLLAEFPEDTKTHDIDEQFMVGSALLTSPVLNPGQTEVNAYFPKGRWFEYTSGDEISLNVGTVITLHTPLNHFNLHIRGGSIVPWQTPETTTYASRRNPMGLLIALDETGTANGNLFWDDGESTVRDGFHHEFAFTMPKAGELIISTTKRGDRLPETLTLNTLEIYGLNRPISNVTIDGGNDQAEVTYFKNIAYITLPVNAIKLPGVQDVTITWTTES